MAIRSRTHVRCMVTILLAVAFALCSHAPAQGAQAQARAERQNLALNRPYSMYPAPNYAHCTGSSDAVDLTDGKYTKGYFWTQQTTVGWHRSPSVMVIIDLGQANPIDAVFFRTPVGGVAGVYVMDRAEFYVSEDGDRFFLAGTAKNPGLPEDGRRLYFHTFRADRMRTRGRYVMVRLFRGRKGGLIFTDEIEVLKGGHDPAKVELKGEPVRRWDLILAQQQIRADTFTLQTAPGTEHVKWAKPLAGGPIRVIWFGSSGAMRPAVECAQRLDMDMIPAPHFRQYSTARIAAATVKRVRENLPTADALVIANIRRICIPPELKEDIVARVRKGMGLVVLPWGKWDDKDEFAPLFAGGRLKNYPFGHRSLFRAAPGRPVSVHGCDLGKGRFVRMDVPVVFRDLLDARGAGAYEYPFSIWAHAIAWAAGRTLDVIAGVTVQDRAARVRLAHGPVAAVRLIARGRYFDERWRTQCEARQGTELNVELPALEHGPHTLDVWALDAEDKIVDWTATTFDVAAPASIADVKLDKELYKVGDVIRVAVTLDGDPAGAVLDLRLSDSYGRVLETKQVTVRDAQGAQFTLRKPRPITLSLDLTALLHRGDALLDEMREVVWVDRADQPNFEFLGWYGPLGEPYQRDAMRVYCSLGVDCLATAHISGTRGCARANVRPGYENVYRVGASVKGKGPVREPSLSDPELRERVAQRIRKYAEAGRLTGLRHVSMGDESGIRPYGGANDYDQSPSALADFRAHLKRWYGTAAALNREWGTAFKAFDEATPWTRAQAKGQANPARWVDHRVYMETYFADFHQWCGEEFARTMPGVLVGLSGTPQANSYSGHDWHKLMQAIDHLSGYGGLQGQLHRSFARPGTFLAGFNGYASPLENVERRFRTAPWRQLFDGATGVNFYTLMSASNNNPIVYSDLSLTPNAEFFCEEVRAIKRGPARLLFLCRRENDGIAVHYSQPSLHVATHTGLMDVRDRTRHFVRNLDCWRRALEGIGLSYDFVAAPQVESGALRGYRVFIMPWSSAVSPTEAAEIRRFVARGGVLIADLLCAQRDAHGKPVDGPCALDDVFGMDQPRDLPHLKWTSVRMGDVKAQVLAGYDRLALRGGRALGRIGGAPAIVAWKTGKGQAIFLNFAITNYGLSRFGELPDGRPKVLADRDEVEGPIQAVLEQLMGLAGVEPDVALTEKGGAPHPSARVMRFRDGLNMYVGVVEQAGLSSLDGPINRNQGVTVELRLAQSAYVYNARTGKSFGKTDRWEDVLVPGIPKLYAVLAYAVDGVEIEAPATCAKGRALAVSLRLRASSDPGRHVIHVQALKPDGSEFRPYSTNVVAEKGAGHAVVPFALNDASGIWTIRARDVASGASATASVRLP